LAPDGSLWYTGQGANKLGRLDPKAGEFKEYPLKTRGSGPHGLVADKEGNIWFTPRRNQDHSYDPTRPAQGYRGGLRELLAIAEVKVRRYDFRHHAVSRALSNPQVPLEAAKSYFGWMSPKMVQRYYHANQAAMRVVAAALDEKPAEPAKQPKSRRKATVVEIVTRRSIAAGLRSVPLCSRGNTTQIPSGGPSSRLGLPPSSEEEQ